MYSRTCTTLCSSTFRCFALCTPSPPPSRVVSLTSNSNPSPPIHLRRSRRMARNVSSRTTPSSTKSETERHLDDFSPSQLPPGCPHPTLSHQALPPTVSRPLVASLSQRPHLARSRHSSTHSRCRRSPQHASPRVHARARYATLPSAVLRFSHRSASPQSRTRRFGTLLRALCRHHHNASIVTLYSAKHGDTRGVFERHHGRVASLHLQLSLHDPIGAIVNPFGAFYF